MISDGMLGAYIIGWALLVSGMRHHRLPLMGGSDMWESWEYHGMPSPSKKASDHSEAAPREAQLQASAFNSWIKIVLKIRNNDVICYKSNIIYLTLLTVSSVDTKLWTAFRANWEGTSSWTHKYYSQNSILTRRDDKILWKGSGRDFITTFSHDILACSSCIISPPSCIHIERNERG